MSIERLPKSLSRKSFLKVTVVTGTAVAGAKLISACEMVQYQENPLNLPTQAVPTPTFNIPSTPETVPVATPTREPLVTPEITTNFDSVVYRGETVGESPIFPAGIYGSGSSLENVRFLEVNNLEAELLEPDEQEFVRNSVAKIGSWLTQNGKVGQLLMLRIKETGMSDEFRHSRGYLPIFIEENGAPYAFFSTDQDVTLPIGWSSTYFPWQMGFSQDGKITGLLIPGTSEGEKYLTPLIEERDGSFYYIDPWGTGEFLLDNLSRDFTRKIYAALIPLNEFSLTTYDQMKSEILAGEIDKYLGVTLTTKGDFEEYYKTQYAEIMRAKREQEVLITLSVLDTNLPFHFNLKGVIVDEAFSDAVKNISLKNTEIIIRKKDGQGNFTYINRDKATVKDIKGYGQIEVKGFPGGDGGIFVWGYDGFLRVILPKGETDLSLWKFMPEDDSDVLFLTGQTYYRKAMIVGANADAWGVVQVNDSGQVQAFGGKEGFADKPETSWKLATGVQPVEATPIFDENLIGRVLGDAEKREKGLNGYAIEAVGYVQGLETKFIFVTVPEVMEEIEKIGGVAPIHLNRKLKNPAANDRLAESIRLGDYLGYLEDSGLNESKYTFDQYIQDLKNGEDRSYKILFSNTGLYGEYFVDPMAVHQQVWTIEKIDPLHGKANIERGMTVKTGFVPLPDGAIRTIGVLARELFYLNGDTLDATRMYIERRASSYLLSSLFILGLSKDGQVNPFNYPGREVFLDTSKSEAKQTIYNLLGTQLPEDDLDRDGPLFSIH